MKRVIRYLFLSLNVIAALLLVVTYISPKIDPQLYWWPSLVGLGYTYLLMVNLGFVLLWLFFYWRYLFVSLICLAIGWNVHQNSFRFSGRQTEDTTGITVLSYNVLHFYSYLEGKKNDTAILEFIASRNANIICLQETKLQKSGLLNPIRLKEFFPGINHCQLAHQSEWGGPVTFTSYPIVNMGELRFEGTHNMVIFTDVIIEKDTVRIYNCHLQSYGIRSEDYSIIDTLEFKQKQLHEVKQIGVKLKDAYQQRSMQIKKLKEHIDGCKYPLLVCGDFNDTPVSYSYHTIHSTLNDAFVESGSGLSNTYRGKLPPFRIDYIFFSDEFEAYNYRRPHVEFSDHFPITALLKKK
ncbi:MAG: endonuclease/exonuclease/phosphatase family protein [Prolixibacteraceae bacterium]